MKTVLITIVGPESIADIAAPADTPVAELLPSFADLAAGGADGGDWELSGPGRRQLDVDLTLTALGVADGAVLHLRTSQDEPPAYELERPVPVADGRSPLARTTGLLPARVGLASRLSSAVGAAAARTQDQPARATRAASGAADPRALTKVASSTPLQRARARWRSTDYQRRLSEEIRAPRLQRCTTIAVVSPKGGVGKTTLTALLGTLFAFERRDRCVAIDTNPDYGSLGRTLTPGHDIFVDDVLDLLEQPDLTATQLDASLGRASDGLMVLPSPTDPARMARLDRDAYITVISRLQHMAGLLILDCGTGLQEPAAQAAIMAADQLLLVTDAEPSTASLVAEAAELLEHAGPPLVLVVNKHPGSSARLDLASLEAQVPRALGMLTVELDQARAARVASGAFSWADDPGGWAISVRELAVVLTSGWPRMWLMPGG
jgi:MinD-like ATPase involved in chromosome partitioning or flagellar assembly